MKERKREKEERERMKERKEKERKKKGKKARKQMTLINCSMLKRLLLFLFVIPWNNLSKHKKTIDFPGLQGCLKHHNTDRRNLIFTCQHLN